MSIRHSLLCGVTESGKTTLAREIANRLQAKKHNVIVYDPLGTPTANGGWGKNALIFTEPELFTEYLSRDDVMHAHVFVDESIDIFDSRNTPNIWMLTKGKHFGFQFYLIAQRPKMLPPNVRTMCATCYMFRLARDDAREICADFGHSYPDVLSSVESDKEVIKELDTGDYLILTSGNVAVSRANIFDQLQEK